MADKIVGKLKFRICRWHDNWFTESGCGNRYGSGLYSTTHRLGRPAENGAAILRPSEILMVSQKTANHGRRENENNQLGNTARRNRGFYDFGQIFSKPSGSLVLLAVGMGCLSHKKKREKKYVLYQGPIDMGDRLPYSVITVKEEVYFFATRTVHEGQDHGNE
ncbi:MAG: hypothetical protein ACOY32_15035 [Thermodesulfobacteriota bacterium]